MDNLYLDSKNTISSKRIRERITVKFFDALQQIQVLSSDYLVWPLVPSTEQLNEYFDACYPYHCSLRISLGRYEDSGKLKCLVDHIDNVFEKNELNVSDVTLSKYLF